jgi:Holliday junction resolvasome RuvABC ATP-dependent DNA helicase subunit
MNSENRYEVSLVNKEWDAPDLSVFDGIVGQNEAIKKLKFFIASHSEDTPFPTMLFTGSQGLGKSFMSAKIAQAFGRDLVEVNCGTIEKADDFIKKVLLERVAGDKGKVLLLDEAHQLSPDITTLLLSLLNPNKTNKNYITYKNWTIEYDFGNIATILTTTDAHKIFKPLLNRCVEVYYHLYSNEDLFDIVQQYIKGVQIDANPADIAYACRGRARDAFVLSQNIQRYCIMKNTHHLTDRGWEELREIFSIHPKGLKTPEIDLMRVLEVNGPTSCNNLAIKLGVNTSNIESELELRPRELGLIKSSPKGRCLTDEGEAYLSEIN